MHFKDRQLRLQQNRWPVLPVLILLLFANPLFAQDSLLAKRFYVGISALSGNASVTDNYFSSIPFTGPAYGAALRAGLTQRKSTHEISWWFNSAHTTAESMEGQTMDQFFFKGDYTYLYRITNPKKTAFILSAGAGADFQEASRTYNEFVNNYQSYEFIASANLVGLVGYEIKKGPKKLVVSDQFRLPFLSVLKQPKLGGTEGTWQTGSWALVQSFSNLLKLERDFGARHQLGIAYKLDYYTIQTVREISQAQHFFEINYAYRF
jgi:hypothetical protein